jgi:hypothetical protein
MQSPVPFRRDGVRSVRDALDPMGEIVPFPRSAKLDRVSDNAGNFVERTPLALDCLGAGEPLRELYDYWHELRATTRCSFADVSATQLMGLGLIGRLHVVDVSSSDPGDFRFDLLGYAIPIPLYPKPRAIPVAVYADGVMADYNTVRLTAAPRLHKLRGQLSGVVCHYTRLILPFFDDQGRVSRLLVGVRLERGDGTRLHRSSQE